MAREQQPFALQPPLVHARRDLLHRDVPTLEDGVGVVAELGRLDARTELQDFGADVEPAALVLLGRLLDRLGLLGRGRHRQRLPLHFVGGRRLLGVAASDEGRGGEEGGEGEDTSRGHGAFSESRTAGTRNVRCYGVLLLGCRNEADRGTAFVECQADNQHIRGKIPNSGRRNSTSFWQRTANVDTYTRPPTSPLGARCSSARGAGQNVARPAW